MEVRAENRHFIKIYFLMIFIQYRFKIDILFILIYICCIYNKILLNAKYHLLYSYINFTF